jgi:predicted NBD/HSP70 family sugar kinase
MASPTVGVTRGEVVPSAILGLLGTRGPSSRAGIARTLNVSPATVTQTTKELIARKLVVELDSVPSRGGRPGRLLGLAGSASGAIGAKVTADHVAIVDVQLDGTVMTSTSQPFDPRSPDAVDNLCRILKSAVQTRDGQLLGVGVGVPGSVDSQASGVVNAPTLGWSEAQVGPMLRVALGLPVLVDNDVNTLATAERIYGVGRAYNSYLVLTIGRGIGCGIVIDGNIYRGANGGAGEIGHIPVSEDGPACECGAEGCLEAMIGDAALLAQAIARGAVGTRATTASLLKAARANNGAALDIYRNAGALLGRALAGVIQTLDPEVVVILGEGVNAWSFWEQGFEQSFRRHLMPARRGIPFVVEPWTEYQWALGAASLVLGTPFDVSGNAGEQGRLVRARLQSTPVEVLL